MAGSAAQNPTGGSITGVITDPDGAALPASVTAIGPGGRRTVAAGNDGRYALVDLTPGVYEVGTSLGGFCSERRRGVQVDERTSVELDLTLWLRPVQAVIHVGGFRLADAYRLADAVVYLRITSSEEPRMWPADADCGTVVAEHEAAVLEEIKSDPAHGPRTATVRLLQFGAGTWADEFETVVGEAPFAVGQEYVAFLSWRAEAQRFTRLDDSSFMVPVRGGRISWQRPHEPDVQDGMPVRAFIELLGGREQ